MMKITKTIFNISLVSLMLFSGLFLFVSAQKLAQENKIEEYDFFVRNGFDSYIDEIRRVNGGGFSIKGKAGLYNFIIKPIDRDSQEFWDTIEVGDSFVKEPQSNSFSIFKKLNLKAHTYTFSINP